MQHMDEEILLLCKKLSEEPDTAEARVLVQRINEALAQRQALMRGIARSVQSTPVEAIADFEARPKKSPKKRRKAAARTAV